MPISGIPQNTIPIDIPRFDINFGDGTPGFDIDPTEFHYEYKESIFSWYQTRCSIAGEHRVKQEDELFLPIPTAMVTNPVPAPSQGTNYWNTTSARTGHIRPESVLARQYNPNWHTNASYMGYKTRAQFPEIVNYTLRGLLGLVIKQLPTVSLPPELDYIEKNATFDGKTLNTLFLYSLAEVLTTGRIFLLADIDKEDDNKLKIAVYTSETISNWRTAVSGSDDARLYEVVLLESNKTNGYSAAEREVLHLAQTNNGYESKKVNVKQDKGKTETTEAKTQPSYMGKTMPVIPGVAIGSNNLTPMVDKAPLSGMSRTAIQIYQLDADLRQAEYMTCNPTLVITGVDSEDMPKVVGSTIAIALPDPQSKAYYTETDTSALDHIRSRISDLHDYAMVQGASLLGGQRNVSESGEALRIRQASTSATLVSVTYTVGRGIQKVLDYMAEWAGATEEPFFEPNTEFTTYSMTAQEQLATVNSWLEGAISDETLLDNFRKAGMLQAGDTIQDEMEKGGGKKREKPTAATAEGVAGFVGNSSKMGTGDTVNKFRPEDEEDNR